MSVRAARVGDAEAIVAVHEAAWDATLGVLIGAGLGRLASRAQRVERMRDGLQALPPDASVLVSEVDGRVVAMGVVRRTDGEPGEVRDLYVSPQAWGTGIAGILLEAMVAWLRDRGATEAGLWVVAENARARRFYERNGWVPDGEERLTDLGPGEVHYRLALGDAT